MRVLVGKLAEGREVGADVVFDTQRVRNGHGVFIGTSGDGKSHNLRRFVHALIRDAKANKKKLIIHILDPHDDLSIEDESAIEFTPLSPYGFNLLEIDPDPKYGGVNPQIDVFLNTMNRMSEIGTNQESIIRNLLLDLYAMHGFYPDDPDSWVDELPSVRKALFAGKEDRLYLDVSFEHKDRFKAMLAEIGKQYGGFDDTLIREGGREKMGWWIRKDRYDGAFLMWPKKMILKRMPTIDDLVEFCRLKMAVRFNGGNGASTALMDEHRKQVQGFHKKVQTLNRSGEVLSAEEREAITTQMAKYRDKAITAFSNYLMAVENNALNGGLLTPGKEFDDWLKYGDNLAMKSVYTRLTNLQALKIFSGERPRFSLNAMVWRYRMKGILDEGAQRMFRDTVMRDIFRRRKQMGERDDVVELIIQDESKIFKDEKPNNIADVITLQSRKFGLAFWQFAQSPSHVNPEFLENVSFRMVLGLGQKGVREALKELGLPATRNNDIVPHKYALVSIKNKGEKVEGFQLVDVSQAVVGG